MTKKKRKSCICTDWGPDQHSPSGTWICKNCGEDCGCDHFKKTSIISEGSEKCVKDGNMKSPCGCGCGNTNNTPCNCGCHDNVNKKMKCNFEKSETLMNGEGRCSAKKLARENDLPYNCSRPISEQSPMNNSKMKCDVKNFENLKFPLEKGVKCGTCAGLCISKGNVTLMRNSGEFPEETSLPMSDLEVEGTTSKMKCDVCNKIPPPRSKTSKVKCTVYRESSPPLNRDLMNECSKITMKCNPNTCATSLSKKCKKCCQSQMKTPLSTTVSVSSTFIGDSKTKTSSEVPRNNTCNPCKISKDPHPPITPAISSDPNYKIISSVQIKRSKVKCNRNTEFTSQSGNGKESCEYQTKPSFSITFSSESKSKSLMNFRAGSSSEAPKCSRCKGSNSSKGKEQMIPVIISSKGSMMKCDDTYGTSYSQVKCSKCKAPITEQKSAPSILSNSESTSRPTITAEVDASPRKCTKCKDKVIVRKPKCIPGTCTSRLLRAYLETSQVKLHGKKCNHSVFSQTRNPSKKIYDSYPVSPGTATSSVKCNRCRQPSLKPKKDESIMTSYKIPRGKCHRKICATSKRGLQSPKSLSKCRRCSLKNEVAMLGENFRMKSSQSSFPYGQSGHSVQLKCSRCLEGFGLKPPRGVVFSKKDGGPRKMGRTFFKRPAVNATTSTSQFKAKGFMKPRTVESRGNCNDRRRYEKTCAPKKKLPVVAPSTSSRMNEKATTRENNVTLQSSEMKNEVVVILKQGQSTLIESKSSSRGIIITNAWNKDRLCIDKKLDISERVKKKMGSTVSKKRKNNRCSAVNKKVSDTSTRSKTSIVSKTSKASQTSNCSSHDVKSSNSCNKGKKCSECKASRNSCDYYTIEQPVDLSKGSNNSRCMSKSYQSCPDKSPTCTRSEMKETKVSEEEEACPCNCGFYQEGEIAVFPCGCDPQAESLKNEKKEATSKSSLQKPIVTDCGGQGGNSSHKVASNCIESTKSSSSTNRQPLKNILTNTNEQTESQKTVDKLQKDMSSVQKKSEALQKLIENCCCAENPIFPHKSASSSPIKATHSGLTAAIKFLQAKCRTKDGMIAILAQELRNSSNIDQIGKNLTAPCLQYTGWDFDQEALYLYLKQCQQKSDAKCSELNLGQKGCKFPISLTSEKVKISVPKPTNFLVQRSLCHCAFVTWTLPRDLNNVTGYQILADGKIVAKVRCSTRNQALLGSIDISKIKTLSLYAVGPQEQLSDPVTISLPN